MKDDESTTDPYAVLRATRVATPVRDQLLTLLRQEILDLELKPGQRLIERELVERTGVSRTTIREVLGQLAAEGLVANVPQKGVVVVAPSTLEAAELYEIRGILEALAVRRFIDHASDIDFEDLRLACDRVAVVLTDQAEVLSMLRAKDAFYEVLLRGAASSMLRRVLGGLQAQVRSLRATSLSQEGRPEEAVAELRALTQAILERDADTAAKLCETHISHAASTGIDALAVRADEVSRVRI